MLRIGVAFPEQLGKHGQVQRLKLFVMMVLEADVDEQGTVYMRLGDTTKFEYKGDKAKTEKERLVIGDSVFLLSVILVT
ncbi:MAG: hypothetical protein CM15mP127_10090 [Gammaproteobacteria bacterium]|nr:MAG: hypothetical protein CM15mP127_10090 [Gammaproteobacteria bacterium]